MNRSSDDKLISHPFAPREAVEAAQVVIGAPNDAKEEELLRNILVGVCHLIPLIRPRMRSLQNIHYKEGQRTYYNLKDNFSTKM